MKDTQLQRGDSLAKEYNTTLKTFAEQNRLVIQKDECGDFFAPGRLGEIYTYDAERGLMAVTVLGGGSRHWNKARKTLKAAKCIIVQNGDTEGTATFDPGNPEQTKVVLDVIKVRRKRKSSPKQLANLALAV
jgi:hypothetical protein